MTTDSSRDVVRHGSFFFSFSVHCAQKTQYRISRVMSRRFNTNVACHGRTEICLLLMVVVVFMRCDDSNTPLNCEVRETGLILRKAQTVPFDSETATRLTGGRRRAIEQRIRLWLCCVWRVRQHACCVPPNVIACERAVSLCLSVFVCVWE